MRSLNSAVVGAGKEMSKADEVVLWTRLGDSLYACAVAKPHPYWGTAGENSRNANLYDSAFFSSLAATTAKAESNVHLECELLRVTEQRYEMLESRRAEAADDGRFGLLEVGARTGRLRAERLIATDCHQGVR